MGRVLVMGYLSIDDITVGASLHQAQPGGGALYGALGARAAGAAVTLSAACGMDFAPEWLARLGALGIDASSVERRPGPTRRARLVHAHDGGRASPHHAETIWSERTAALAPAIPRSVDADAVMLAPMPLAHLARCLEGIEAPIAADTSEGFASAGLEAWRALLPRFAVFAPSREETRLLFPGRGCDDAARALAAFGCDVVHKRGAEGLALCRAGSSEVRRIPAAPVALVDPTGAGDAVVGALAAGLARGLDLDANASQAALIGARAVTGLGPAAFFTEFAP